MAARTTAPPCEPTHLEPVTTAENNRRRDAANRGGP